MKDTQGNIINSEKFTMTDNNHMTTADDKYTDSIDLSNACREFYQTRKQAAEVVKERLATSGRQRHSKKTSIDVAMETLRTEMSSLMDQDLSLMKSLLTLNEAIEDLKWQKKYYHSEDSVPDSSCNLSDSDWSVSETDMFGSENEVSQKYPTPSSLSIHSHFKTMEKLSDTTSESNIDKCDKYSNQTNFQSQKTSSSSKTQFPADFDFFLAGNSNECHDEQNSFDSGIHEPVLRKEITV